MYWLTPSAAKWGASQTFLPMKRNALQISYFKTNTGGWLLYTMGTGNRLISHTYIGYTKREATALFRAYVKEELKR